MLQVTGTEQLRAWERCVLPPVEQVRPGLWSIPVPIPDNPLRYVLVYVLDAGAAVALVDAGWNTDDAWAALVAGLEQIGAAISDVAAVLVTHMHPDHYGLAGRVRERSGAWIGLHPADADLLQARYLEPDDLLARMRVLMEDAGVPAERLPDLQMTSMVLRAHVAMAEPDVLFADGEPVAVPGWDLQALWTPGHSPGHVCFYSEQHRLLLSGDHILPRISPNIAVHTQQFPDPLGDYLASLRKCQPLVVDEVLPAHEYRFAGLSDRVEELVRHHLERLAEIESLLSDHPGASAWDLSVRLRWSRPWEEIEPFMQRAEWARRWPIWCCSNDTGGSPARARPRSASGASATGRTAPADLRRIQARGWRHATRSGSPARRLADRSWRRSAAPGPPRSAEPGPLPTRRAGHEVREAAAGAHQRHGQGPQQRLHHVDAALGPAGAAAQLHPAEDDAPGRAPGRAPGCAGIFRLGRVGRGEQGPLALVLWSAPVAAGTNQRLTVVALGRGPEQGPLAQRIRGIGHRTSLLGSRPMPSSARDGRGCGLHAAEAGGRSGCLLPARPPG